MHAAIRIHSSHDLKIKQIREDNTKWIFMVTDSLVTKIKVDALQYNPV